MEDQKKRLKEHFLKASLLTELEWIQFENLWVPFEADRNSIITAEGTIEKYLYFITEGVQRIYSAADQKKEATLIFTYPYSFGGVLDSFLLQTSSKYTYQALTPSTFLRLPHSSFVKATSEHPQIDQIIKEYTYHAISGLLERMVELQSFSSEEKFKTLLKRSPHLLQLIPHKYLANYLGIDPTNFSKLINRVKI